MTEALRAHFADYAAFHRTPGNKACHEHYVYEKNSPAFFKNFAHLAVGQLWILAKAVGRA